MTRCKVTVFYNGTLPILDAVQGACGVVKRAKDRFGRGFAISHSLALLHDPVTPDSQLATQDDGWALADNPDASCQERFANPQTRCGNIPATWLHGGLIGPLVASAIR